MTSQASRQQAAAYSGTRPLSEVLEHNRVLRGAREASLAAEYVYGRDRDGNIYEWPITKWTPKRVWFRTGDRTWRGEPLDINFADRQMFEKHGHAGVFGGGYYGCTIYPTRAAAEAG